MKMHFVVIVIGIFFLVIGPSLGYFYAYTIFDKYPSLSILISDVMLEPAQSIRGSIALEEGKKIFVTIVAEPSFNTVYLSINSTDNSKEEKSGSLKMKIIKMKGLLAGIQIKLMCLVTLKQNFPLQDIYSLR